MEPTQPESSGQEPTDTSPTTILLVEDEPLWQEGIRSLIGMEGDLELVGVEDNYDEALTRYREAHPDIVLLDWKIVGDKDGLDLGEALVQEGHDQRHLILVSGSDKSLFPNIPYPFVPKPQIASLLIDTIRSVTNR